MARVKTLRSKVLYKFLLILLKYIPIIITLFYILNIATAMIGIDIPVFSYTVGISLLTWLFMYIAAWVFQFCIYHRMFLYYVLVTDLMNIYDCYVGIDYDTVPIHSVVVGVSLLLILYLYVKYNKKFTT